MSAIIKTLKTTNDVEQSVYPKTVLEAVVDAETNETLDVILDNLNEKIDNIEPGGSGGATYELGRTDDTITLTGSDGSSSEVDVTPVENLLVYPYAISNETTDNYTIVDNGDGTLTISCNFPELSMTSVQIVSNQPISAGTYTVSGCPEGFIENTVDVNVYVDDASGNRIHYGSIAYGQNFTFTVTELCYLSLNLSFNSGASLTDAVLKPMLELGTVAHDYKPYKDVSKANQTDIDNKVSKSGDTMTGALNVRDSVYIASERDNTGEIIKPVPIAGVLQDEITDFTNLSKFKSFIGSAYYDTGWHSIISSRHRNGVGDGAYYGMMLSSPMTPKTATLRWNRQYGDGKWQGERVILDSNNYSTYALPLTGGTVDGSIDIAATSFPALTLTRSGSTNCAGIKFVNDNGVLGGFGMTKDEQTLTRYGKDLSTGYTILDAGNYSNYALPLSGGTVTGATTFNSNLVAKSEGTKFEQDYYVHNFASGSSSTGYWKFATIKTNNTYIGGVLKFTIHQRGLYGDVHINFNNVSTESGAGISSIRQTGSLSQVYYVKTATQTFDLYLKKPQSYDNATVTRIDTSKYIKDRITITWTDTYVASLPTGATAATATNDWTTVVTSTTSSVSINLASTKDIYMVWAISGDNNHGIHFSVKYYQGGFKIYDTTAQSGGAASISGNTLTVSVPSDVGGITVKYLLIR